MCGMRLPFGFETGWTDLRVHVDVARSTNVAQQVVPVAQKCEPHRPQAGADGGWDKKCRAAAEPIRRNCRISSTFTYHGIVYTLMIFGYEIHVGASQG